MNKVPADSRTNSHVGLQMRFPHCFLKANDPVNLFVRLNGLVGRLLAGDRRLLSRYRVSYANIGSGVVKC
jgi:hypothetical protein